MEVPETLKSGLKINDELKSLSFTLKVILVVWGDIYGLLRRLTSGKTVPVIVGVLQFITGNFFGIMWLIDLIIVITKKEVTVLAD